MKVFVALLCFLLVISVIILSGYTDESDTDQRLSREEQIELMLECIEDAQILLEQGSDDHWFIQRNLGVFQIRAAVASAFFEYRTR